MTTAPTDEPIIILNKLEPREFHVLRNAGNFTIPPGNSTLDVSPAFNIAGLVAADKISVAQKRAAGDPPPVFGISVRSSVLNHRLEESIEGCGHYEISFLLVVGGRGSAYNRYTNETTTVQQGDLILAKGRYGLRAERSLQAVSVVMHNECLGLSKLEEKIFNYLAASPVTTAAASATEDRLTHGSFGLPLEKLSRACFPNASGLTGTLALNYVEIEGSLPENEPVHYHHSHVVAQVFEGTGILKYAPTRIDPDTKKIVACGPVAEKRVEAPAIVVIPRNALHVFDAPNSSLKYVALEIGETPNDVDHQMHHKDVVPYTG